MKHTKEEMIETQIKTYRTNDYGIFKTIVGNRTISLHNVNSIIDNIKKNGVLPTVIIVNEKMEVIDGQHRLEAFKQLGVPIEYQIRKGLSLKDCIAYNVSGKKWEIIDYIESYAELGNEEYKTLLRVVREFPNIPVRTLVMIISSRNTTNKIYNGGFTLEQDVNSLIGKLNFVDKVNGLIQNIRGYKSRILSVIGNLYDMEEIDQERMIEQIEKWGDTIDTVATENDALRKLEEVYNYRKRQKVYFVSHYKELQNQK